MVTIQKNLNWQDKTEVKKGNIGELLVKEFLEKNGFTLYSPVTEGSHKVDYFAHSEKEKNVICAEVKTKRRMAFHERTGFNYSNYLHYKELYEKHKIPTYIFFVDDFEKCIYGQWLHKLGEGVVMGTGWNEVIVWDLNLMDKKRELTESEVLEISKYTKENYDYSGVIKYFKKTT